MAYPITSDVAALLKAPHVMTATVRFEGTVAGQSFDITEADILQGGLSVNRYSLTGSTIEVGAVSAAELVLKLNNTDKRFNDITFEGGEMYVTIHVADPATPDTKHNIPLGYFTVDEAPRKLATMTMPALDRMVQFDREADAASIVFPLTVADLVHLACERCDVNLSASVNLSLLPNSGYEIKAAPGGSASSYTWRQYLAFCAQLMGCCGYIDHNGELMLKWYDTTPSATLTPADRFSSDLDEQAVTVTGVSVTANGFTKWFGGEGYAVSVKGNPLLTGATEEELQAVAGGLGATITGFSYTPFKATVIPSPHLWPMDLIVFQDANGNDHSTVITEITFSLNHNTQLAGKGQTATRRGYATANPLTAREQAIIEEMLKRQNDEQNARVQDVLGFNQLIANALGVHVVTEVSPDGSTVYYLCDRPTLEASRTVFTLTASGIAWGVRGTDGEIKWTHGVTAAGQALFDFISARGISVSEAGNDYTVDIRPHLFRISYRDMVVTEIHGDEMEIPKVKVTEGMTVGAVKLVPYEVDGTPIGANLIFMDQ